METARGGTDGENAQVTPESLHSFVREDGQVLGHRVLDSSVNGLSVGGIRMVPQMHSAIGKLRFSPLAAATRLPKHFHGRCSRETASVLVDRTTGVGYDAAVAYVL